ncbi:MAG TPA: GWxTD domain-containing protein [Thermoanaerobaculia bacterium]|nr:GWxTD domain-containing protein [Thermoanaerobaculia bacterium]
MRSLSLALLVLLSAAALVAQTEAALDFPKGPAQWIMTAEERNAWKRVKTEEEAAELVALFWARRDPTPGTFVNEFRDEFNERVKFADARFKEGNRRGSLTERGRVGVTLGFPKSMSTDLEKRSGQYSSNMDGADPTGGRALAAREEWIYTYEESIKFGMPKIEVVFIHDGQMGRVRRDTQRNDFISAIPAATKLYVKNPELTAVPEWARAGALQYEPLQAATTPAEDRPSTLDIRPSETKVEATPSVEVAPKVQGPGSKVQSAPTAKPASVGKLTLVKDAFSLEPENGKDPFAGLANVAEFRRSEELGWVVEYCTGSLDRALSEVQVTLKISGLVKNEKVNFNAPEEDIVPDAIKASPGCYLVRGSVPLMDMDPANYTMFVKIGSYNLTKDFRVIE